MVVPVISLGGLGASGDDGTDRSESAETVAAEVIRACRACGFFQIVDHGIDADLIARVWRQTHAFFAQPMADKRALLRTKDNSRGYYDRELTKNARDLKEVFDFHRDPRPDLASTHPDNNLPVDGHNQWPAALPALRPTMAEFYQALEALGYALMELFCLGIGAPRDRLVPYFGATHTSFIRLNHYPLADILEASEAARVTELGDMALHHHTDAGVLTILLQDDVGGLQVFSQDQWHDVEPIPGAFVINIGDMMQVFSNDAYPAALHRVHPITDRPRYSLPFFFNPSYAADCAPLDQLVGAEGPHYRPVNWGVFRQARADGDFADYGKEIQLDDFRLP